MKIPLKLDQFARLRYLHGLSTYGEIKDNDPRDFVYEALEELADCYNYITWVSMPDDQKLEIICELDSLFTKINQL